MRDQLVCGIRDESTRVELFKLTELTFDKALTEASARERAMKNAAGAVRTLNNKGHEEEMYAIGHAYRGRDAVAATATEQRERTYANTESGCYCCGKPGHRASVCRYRGATCRFCERKGHLERACFKKKRSDSKFLQIADTEHNNSAEDDHTLDFFSLRENDCDAYINSTGKARDSNIKADPMLIDVKLNGKLISMEVDSGSFYSVISEKFKNENLKTWKIDKWYTNLFGYEQNVMVPIGQLKNLKVGLNNKEKKLSCLVLKGEGPPLIGRQWLAEFGAWPLTLTTGNVTGNKTNRLLRIDANVVREKILGEFSVLFGNTPGLYNKREIQLHIKENTKPIALAARHVPYALKSKVDNEISRLIQLGHLAKVEASEWATPIVPVLKSNGEVRICGDLKLTINQYLKVTKTPFPRINDIFNVLQRGSRYSQLDLPHAYMQIPVDKGSQELLTITTHVGLFRYTKMTEGTASAPSEFQQIMNECLQGIPNTIAYLDNIFVTGSTNEEHIENLRKVCRRLEDCNLRLNRDKCEFMKEKIEVLG